MRLRRAVLFAKDLQRMMAFYRDGLGLGVVSGSGSPEWVELDAGGVSLALHAIPPALAAGIEVTSPPSRRSETPLKLVFEVDDLARARNRLGAMGGVMDEPSAWGACDGTDPEGNVFQLVATPQR